jgi:hypothetical protein
VTFDVSDHHLIARTRKTYGGPLMIGADLMSLEVGDAVKVTPFVQK